MYYMNELLQTNIFFVITSVAVVVLTILFIIILFYGITVARKINKLTDTVTKEGAEILKDVHEIRSSVKENAGGVWERVKPFIGLPKRKKTRSQ